MSSLVMSRSPGRGPLAVPVWYRYEPGDDVVFATGDGSRKRRLERVLVRLRPARWCSADFRKFRMGT
jgi:hypothetical protein